MAELRFASGDLNRRRRMLATGHDSAEDGSLQNEDRSGEEMTCSLAFQALSRDQMIRRVISPRIWKHAILVSLLLLIPSALLLMPLFTTPPLGPLSAAIQKIEPGEVARILHGIAGLELFAAGQLCLLICWVRSASAVDFRGHYRTWRWLATFLIATSVFLLTGAGPHVTHMLAELIAPVLGSIQAAKPALLFVPAGAFAAFILRYLIPDMGRCRTAQGTAIIAIVLIVARVVIGIRGPFRSDSFSLAGLDLLICGLTLSAIQLHCRYVVHVNPNPPIVIRRSPGQQAAGKSKDSFILSAVAVENDTPTPIVDEHPAAEPETIAVSPNVVYREADDEDSEGRTAKARSSNKSKSSKKPARKAG